MRIVIAVFSILFLLGGSGLAKEKPPPKDLRECADTMPARDYVVVGAGVPFTAGRISGYSWKAKVMRGAVLVGDARPPAEGAVCLYDIDISELNAATASYIEPPAPNHVFFINTSNWEKDFVVYGSKQKDIMMNEDSGTQNFLPARATFYGGKGDDTLIGGEKSDTLSGGAGDDELSGIGGVDVLYGGAGDDKLWAGWGYEPDNGYKRKGNEKLYGGRGDDTLYGIQVLGKSWGKATLYGGWGDDTLISWGGDTFYGGKGSDDFIHWYIARRPEHSDDPVVIEDFDLEKDFLNFRYSLETSFSDNASDENPIPLYVYAYYGSIYVTDGKGKTTKAFTIKKDGEIDNDLADDIVAKRRWKAESVNGSYNDVTWERYINRMRQVYGKAK